MVVDVAGSCIHEPPTSKRQVRLMADELTTIRSINQLRLLLEEGAADHEVMSVLKQLHVFGLLSLTVLRTTLIGQSVNHLRKSTQNDQIRQKSKELLVLWKSEINRSVNTAGHNPPAKRRRSQSVVDLGEKHVQTTPPKDEKHVETTPPKDIKCDSNIVRKKRASTKLVDDVGTENIKPKQALDSPTTHDGKSVVPSVMTSSKVKEMISRCPTPLRAYANRTI